jgi:hypothetical protein
MASRAKDDLGEAEVQKNVDEELEQGFRGEKVDPRPNSDYSLQSGPDSPSAHEQLQDAREAQIKDAKESTR